MLDKIFSDSNINLNYNSTEFSIDYIKKIDYNAAKTLFKYLFIKRAERIVKKSWLIVVNFYNYFSIYK